MEEADEPMFVAAGFEIVWLLLIGLALVTTLALATYAPEDPVAELVEVSSNAEGARRARDEVGTAAIAGDAAAEVYGLDKLIADIEDRPDNTTRFLVIGRSLFPANGEPSIVPSQDIVLGLYYATR